MELPSDNRITSTKSPQFYKMNLSTSLTNLTVVLPQLRVFDNWVLRRIFGPNRDEVTGEWRKLHNEELNDLYCSPYIVRVVKSRRMRWAEQVACIGERRGVYRVVVGKTVGHRPLGRPRGRWKNNTWCSQ